MDVFCERCGTEYEFDETLLSGRGTSVKCTNCGHVFKVYPKAQPDADRTTSVWRLKLADGSIDTIDALGELQRRISNGELTPDNEIARGDEGWKTLGSIPELEVFFQAAGVEIRSGRIPSPVPPPQNSKDSSLPPGRPRQPTLLGVMPIQKMIPVGAGLGMQAESAAGEAAEAEAATAQSEAEMAAGALSGLRDDLKPPQHVSDPTVETAPAGLVPAPKPSGEIEDAEYEEQSRALARTAGRPGTPPATYYDEEDDMPDLPGRGWSPLRWLLVIVVVGGMALVATQWERVAGLLSIGSDPASIAAGVVEGDAAVAEGHPQAYANAIEAYGRAIEAGGDRDPEILAKLSNAYALAAQAQIDDGASGASIASLTVGALTTAQTASGFEPPLPAARLALADALRLTGEYAQAREALDQAGSMSFSRTAEYFRVDARLAAAEADGALENGLLSANQAAELAPSEVRYLLLLSRAERAAGDDEGARGPLETILLEHPGHPVATKLLAELKAAAVADAGVAGDAGTAATTDTAAETEAETDAVAEAVAETDAVAAAETAAESGTESETAVAEAESEVAEATVEKETKVREPRASKDRAYDEYDRLTEAAGSDEFVDGRPPVRDYEWYIERGYAELAAGNYVRARAFFDGALEAHPGSAEAMDGLGHVSSAVGDEATALRYFRVAAQRGHPDGYYNLGKTYERLGRNEEAVSAYYTYLKRRPTGTHAAAARAAIKTLEPRAKLPPEPSSQPGVQ